MRGDIHHNKIRSHKEPYCVPPEAGLVHVCVCLYLLYLCPC